MKNLEEKAHTQYPPPPSLSITTIHSLGTHCLASVRLASRSLRLARVLESGTNEVHRAMERFLFREIARHRSVHAIARNLSVDGRYNDCDAFPAAHRFLHKEGALGAEEIVRHVGWRLVAWPWWPMPWERELLRGTSLEEVAWALHEGWVGGLEGLNDQEWEDGWGKGAAGGEVGRREVCCCHGARTRGEGCGWFLRACGGGRE